ncbi:hypothetical protein TgHK011_004326 [Trichoderma gracile]|nr:hypothetical protein TgHK011_004326 [Trichoderma gracile]
MAVSPGSQRHPLPNMRLDAGFWLLNATELLTGCALLGSEVRVAFHVSGDITNWPGTVGSPSDLCARGAHLVLSLSGLGKVVDRWSHACCSRFVLGDAVYGNSRGTRTGKNLSPSDLYRLKERGQAICRLLARWKKESHTTEVHGIVDAILSSAALFVRGVYGPAQRNMAELSNDLVRLGV